MPFATLQFTQRESVRSNCQLQSGFNADLRQKPCRPISDSSLAAFTHKVTPFCLRVDHQSVFNSTSSLSTLNSQDVVPKRAWFTLGHGQTLPGKLSSENQTAGHWEAAACPDQLNLGEERWELCQAWKCGLVKGHGYSHIRAVTFPPIHMQSTSKLWHH